MSTRRYPRSVGRVGFQRGAAWRRRDAAEGGDHDVVTFLWGSKHTGVQGVHWVNVVLCDFIGKPQEDHGSTLGKWWFHAILWDLPSGYD